MTVQPEHRALAFIAAIAILGAAVRVARAVGDRPAAGPQPALEHQMQAADSAAKAGQRRNGSMGGGRAIKRDTSGAGSSQDTGSAGKRRRRRAASAPSTGDSAKAASHDAALDRPGYIGGKLDLDVATAAQIHSLPGVSAAMARRLAADRMSRGPFLNLDGMRRVAGVGPRFVAQIDSLVTFSGTVQRGTAADTVVPPRQSRGRKASAARPARPP